MIYTLTLNPALDYVVRADSFKEGLLNRAQSTEIQFGGKGINVSTVLHRLGVESVATGFIAGFTGDALEYALHDMGLQTDFVRLSTGLTRINVKLKSQLETEINAPGPAIPEESLNKLLQKLTRLQRGDILVLSGSIPPSLPENIYQTILAALDGQGILSVVDTGGKALRSTLRHRPFLIKPNLAELCELAGRDLPSVADIADYAKLLQQEGARNVLVSLAGDGSLLLDETGKLHQLFPKRGILRNSVGAGDSMVAGFLAGWLTEKNYAAAHRLGSAAGSATAFSEGLADREAILSLYSQEDDPS